MERGNGTRSNGWFQEREKGYGESRQRKEMERGVSDGERRWNGEMEKGNGQRSNVWFQKLEKGDREEMRGVMDVERSNGWKHEMERGVSDGKRRWREE